MKKWTMLMVCIFFLSANIQTCFAANGVEVILHKINGDKVEAIITRGDNGQGFYVTYLGEKIRVDCNEIAKIQETKYLKAAGKVTTGGLTGAAAGAAIGSIFGGIGAIPGAIIGFIFGGGGTAAATDFEENIKKSYCY